MEGKNGLMGCFFQLYLLIILSVSNMKLFSRIYKTMSLIKHWRKYTDCDSYYPDYEHKSKKSMFFDQLFFIWEYGDVEPFYFTYGFDRKDMTRQRMTKEYLLPYSLFQKRINYLNFHHPRYDVFHGRTITCDKFYFYLFLNQVGIPTPNVYCYIKSKAPLYFDPSFKINSTMSARDQMSMFLSSDMDAFVKPSAGQLGKGTFTLRVSSGRIFIEGIETPLSIVVDKLLSADYLVQERIKQHPKLASLNSSSINTIRLQTVIDRTGQVHSFGAGLRIGRRWSSVDNWAKGGVFVGINMDKGTLKPLGIIKPQFGTSVTTHPDSGVEFSEFEIPFYKEAESMAIQLHRFLYRCHSVGWDIAITEHGPVFFEGNGQWEISLVQAVQGGLKNQIEKFFM